MKIFPERVSIASSSWIAPTSCIVGDVLLSDNVGVWFGSVLRADNEPIVVGDYSNIQDGCVLHNDKGYPVKIGKMVTVGHGSILHGCIVDDVTLIGMGCIILNGCHISSFCLIGAGTLITENTFIPERSLVLGRPGKVVRSLSDSEIEGIKENAVHYVSKKELYRSASD